MSEPSDPRGWKRFIVAGGTAVSILVGLGIVEIEVGLREEPGTAACVAAALALFAGAGLFWVVRGIRGRQLSEVAWPAVLVLLAVLAVSFPIALNLVYLDPSARMLGAVGAIGVLACVLAGVVVARLAGATGFLSTLFDGASRSTLLFVGACFAVIAVAVPAAGGTALRISVAVVVRNAAEEDPGPAPSGQDVPASCAIGPGDGTPAAVAEHMRRASHARADDDAYGCLGPAAFDGDHWVQNFARGTAVLVGSSLGAAIIDDVWRSVFERAGGGSLGLGALGGQLRNRSDCGDGVGDVQVVTDEAGRVVLLASRPAKRTPDGEWAEPLLTPTSLLVELSFELEKGRPLVAARPLWYVGPDVYQTFTDPRSPWNEVTLSAPATVGLVAPELASSSPHVELLTRTCDV